LQPGGNETGAVLILALIFALVTALLVGALTTWTANDLHNISNVKSSRSMLAAADGATQVAMGNIRYGFWTSGSCYTPAAINGWTFTVTCTATAVNEQSNLSRVVSVSTYVSGTTNPVIQAQVTYDDIADAGKNDCNTSPTPTTCGTGMTVSSWVVQPGAA
jgi:hypothetical protein